MNFRSNTIRAAAVVATATLGLGGLALAQTGGGSPAAVSSPAAQHVHVDSAVDIRDDRRVVGIADSVFFGEVVGQIGQTQELSIPETQYSVRVVDVIKGSVSGVVTVNQFGGVKEGKRVVPHGENLLEPGQTYLFATRTRVENGWNTVVTGAGATVVKGQQHKAQLHQRYTHARNNEIPFDPQEG